MTEKSEVLHLDGIPSNKPRREGTTFFWFDPQGTWRINSGDRSFEIDGICVQIHDAFRQAIMKGVPYDLLVSALPQFVSVAGHNSESTLSREMFERFLTETAGYPELNRFLYLYDCQRLVSSIQECSKEIVQIMGEFYFTLNMESFFYPPLKQPDGIRYSTSPVTTKLFAYLNFIFIRMHSLLDCIVKLAIESERLQTDFTRYPRISSLSEQFGSRKRVSFNGEQGTLLENCSFVTTVETLRNHIIHDALLDEMPKAYERIEGGTTVEKFILFPDMTNGRFDRYKTRNLFYGSEDKINLRLPGMVTEFQARLEVTLQRVLAVLQRRS
ncbi:hypothetical protein [Microvirga tunisiensis]|uniref:Cthe-2314-like HEPN domain-containing protein n=1 Tax=Microvirga tunisiensis TaxID=2108360 RepID=A0A5N7MSP7_9HYPH|nr:hypothetical protein [Microvirga tunisiensis]MPR12071.1 hypothetical protein [Microvirga tunisiensis]MPR30017.1 hypothetical protein [Microvirga tunisiensis]